MRSFQRDNNLILGNRQRQGAWYSHKAGWNGRDLLITRVTLKPWIQSQNVLMWVTCACNFALCLQKWVHARIICSTMLFMNLSSFFSFFYVSDAVKLLNAENEAKQTTNSVLHYSWFRITVHQGTAFSLAFVGLTSFLLVIPRNEGMLVLHGCTRWSSRNNQDTTLRQFLHYFQCQLRILVQEELLQTWEEAVNSLSFFLLAYIFFFAYSPVFLTS